MKVLVCGRCRGVFSKEMSVQMVRGTPHHYYCAEVVLKKRQDEDSQLQGMRLWIPVLWPTLLLPISKIRS